jgi:hypothetical protein
VFFVRCEPESEAKAQQSGRRWQRSKTKKDVDWLASSGKNAATQRGSGISKSWQILRERERMLALWQTLADSPPGIDHQPPTPPGVSTGPSWQELIL